MAKIPVSRKMKQISILSALWKHRRQLLSMFGEMFRRTYKASMLTIVALIAAIFYVIWPFDVVPDFIPVVGWIDDGFIMYFLLKRLLYELQRYESSKSQLKLVKRR